jgi:Fe-Mn family superoxide dismutase
LHHGTHHLGYVKGANTALDQLDESRSTALYTTLRMLEKDLAFHLGGHINHTLFWKNLSPDGGDRPDGGLGAAIDRNFGSFDNFRAQFEAAATQVQGSGWAVLGYHPMGQKLLVIQFYDHQVNLPPGLIPLLLCDVWEHAYYLDYRAARGDYVKAFWNIVNWADVATRYQAALVGITLP